MHNTTRHAVDSPRWTRPFTWSLATAGWTVAGVGFVVAFVAVAVMGQGATRYEELASGVHRGAMLIMLGGMLLAFIGHRLNWLRARDRGVAGAIDPSSKFEPQPFDPPHFDAQFGDSQVLDAELVNTEFGSSRVFADPSFAPSPLEHDAPLIVHDADRDASDQGLSRDALFTCAYVFGLTIAIVLSSVVLVMANSGLRLVVIVLMSAFMIGAHLVMACRTAGYSRAFALGALIPTLAIICLAPNLVMYPAGNSLPDSLMKSPTFVGLAMLAWIASVPTGFAATGVLALQRYLQDGRGATLR